MLYLIEQYDVEKTLTYDSLLEKNQLNQWLMFQVSGQGPYYGQATWSVFSLGSESQRGSVVTVR